VLQEAGLWRYAATLAAGALAPGPRAAALDRWAAHVHQASLIAKAACCMTRHTVKPDTSGGAPGRLQPIVVRMGTTTYVKP